MSIGADFRWQPLALVCSLLAVSPWLPNPATAQAETENPKMLELWQPGDRGQRMRIHGRVTSLDGSPVPGVRIMCRIRPVLRRSIPTPAYHSSAPSNFSRGTMDS